MVMVDGCFLDFANTGSCYLRVTMKLLTPKT